MLSLASQWTTLVVDVADTDSSDLHDNGICSILLDDLLLLDDGSLLVASDTNTDDVTAAAIRLIHPPRGTRLFFSRSNNKDARLMVQ